MGNSVLGRLLLMLGYTPKAELEELVGGMAKSTSRSGEPTKLAQAIMNRKEFDYAGICAHLKALREQLAQSRMRGPGAVLYYGEMENALRMSAFANDLHYACLHLEEMDTAEKEAFLAPVCETGEALLRAHPALWLARNRLHGMQESVAVFANALAQLHAKR